MVLDVILDGMWHLRSASLSPNLAYWLELNSLRWRSDSWTMHNGLLGVGAAFDHTAPERRHTISWHHIERGKGVPLLPREKFPGLLCCVCRNGATAGQNPNTMITLSVAASSRAIHPAEQESESPHAACLKPMSRGEEAAHCCRQHEK